MADFDSTYFNYDFWQRAREQFPNPPEDEIYFNWDYFEALANSFAVIDPVITANWTAGVEITPIDFSTNFTGESRGYEMIVVPTGLTFNTSNGVLSGTPTNPGGGTPAVIAKGVFNDAQCTLDYTTAAP